MLMRGACGLAFLSPPFGRAISVGRIAARGGRPQGGGAGYAGQRGREVQRQREVPTVAESRSIKKVAGQFWLKFWWVRG